MLSFLACSVSCRPRGSTNSSEPTSNYAKGQRYDSHHHHSSHRLSPGSNLNSHHHHHYTNNNNNHPHHHSKHVHFHHDKQQQRSSHHQGDEVVPEIDESNKISPLHDAPEKRTYPSSSSIALPLVATSSSKSARATTISRNNYPSGSRRLREEDYDEDYEDDDEEEATGGRHAYLMTTDKKKSSKERLTEDEALSQAFEKHMRPSSSIKETPTEEVHDVYAYQLPSDLWFVVRYNRNADGQVEKYM